MADHLLRRQSSSPFDPKSYYTIANVAYPELTLSNGIGWSTVNVTKKGSYSSENWQIYYQQGRYFIRNYDSLSKTQYGLGSSRTTPGLEKASGSFGQQWTLAREDDGWIFTNGLLGNNSFLAVVDGSGIPVMQTTKRAAIWQILINASAGSPKDPAMLADIGSFEVSSSSSASATATSSSSISTRLPTTTGAPTAATTSGTQTLPTSNGSSSWTSGPTGSATGNQDTAQASQGLQTGAIVGISVGAVALVVALGLLGFLLFRRRQSKKLEQQYVQTKPAELGDTPRELPSPMYPKESYAHRVEMG